MQSQKKMPLNEAFDEITAWLDFKKIPENKREEYDSQVKTMAHAMADGMLVLNPETKVFTQTLYFPLTEGLDEPFVKIDYKPRMPVDLVHMELRRVKDNNPDGRLMAHVVALSSEPAARLKKIDTVDYNISTALIMFFL